MGLFSSSKKEKLVAVFDIGSGSVGGAIVKMSKNNNGLPVIIKSVRTETPYRADIDINIFLKDIVSTLEVTANSLYNKKAGAPLDIFAIISSPLYLSETRIIKMSRDKPFVFTSRLANELIQKEILNLNESYKNKYGDFKSAPKMIEQYTMAVSLNGYAVSDPIGKKCTSLEMHMLVSLAPQICLEKIQETISKTFHHKNVIFSSFMLSSYLAIRDKYIDLDTYLLLDIRGEITDVGIITKGVLKAVLSFPFGKRTFFKYMCTKLDIELRDAKELFKLFNEDNLSVEFRQKVVPLFESIENSWGEAFNQCVSTLPHTLVLPSMIFLTADNDIKKWFANALSNDKHIHPATPDNKSTVIMLDGPEFLSMCDVANGGICDPFLMIEVISIMRKICI